MAKGVHPSVLDNGPAYLAANCTSIVAVVAFAPGMSYAAATAAGNVVASAPIAPADFSFTDGAAGARVLNNAAKTDSAADAAGDPTHFLFLDDTTQRVLRWTDETTVGAVSAGGQVSLPNIPLIVRQPVTV